MSFRAKNRNLSKRSKTLSNINPDRPYGSIISSIGGRSAANKRAILRRVPRRINEKCCIKPDPVYPKSVKGKESEISWGWTTLTNELKNIIDQYPPFRDIIKNLNNPPTLMIAL